jgi:hypothetical protein
MMGFMQTLTTRAGIIEKTTPLLKILPLKRCINHALQIFLRLTLRCEFIALSGYPTQIGHSEGNLSQAKSRANDTSLAPPGRCTRGGNHADFLNGRFNVDMILGIWTLRSCADLPKLGSSYAPLLALEPKSQRQPGSVSAT